MTAASPITSCMKFSGTSAFRSGQGRGAAIAFCIALILFLLSVFAAAPSFASVGFRAAASASSTSNGIAYVSVGTAASAASGNVTPGLPGSIQAGDLIVCLVESYDNVAHTTATAGWTQLYSLTGASATHRASLFYRIAAAPNTALTVTHTGGSSIVSRCAAYRGVDTTTPFDVAYAAQYSASSLTVTTGSLTTVNDDIMLLFAAHIANQATTAIPLTVAGGLTWTERIDSSYNGGGAADVAIWLDEAPMASAGAIGPIQETGSLAGVSHGVLLALRGNPTPLTINVPAGTAAGDVMIASVAWTPSSTTVSAPSGWTLIRQSTQGSATTSKLATYYRVATASEPAAYTWTFAGSGLTQSVGGILSFHGVDASSPFDAEAGSLTPAAGTSVSHIAPTVTTTLDDGMLVTVHEMASSVTWTPPLISGTTRMTEPVDIASLTPNNAAGIAIEINYEARATAGATGTRTATASANADRGATQSVSLRPTPLVCWSDSFNRADGPPGSDWIVSNSGGTFGDPVILSNRLRMTNTAGNLATMAKLQRLFPGAGNRIEVEFEHFAYGGTGADGIAVTFSDSSVTPAPGAYGGSLGYAQRSTPSVVNGFAGGWLGVGIDEYGNFSNPTEGRQGGPGFFVDSISIRGSGSGTTGYTYHAGTGTLTPQVDNNGAASPPHKYRIIVDHSNAVNAFVSVERNTGSGYVTLVAPYDAKAQAGQAAVPTSWLLSYTGSSGGSTNIHEIDSLRICATSQTAITGLDHFDITVAASASTCTPQSVTITAKDSTNATLTGYTGTVNLSTSTNHGTWAVGTASGTLTDATPDDGAATYTFVSGDNGSVALTLSNTHADDLTISVVEGSVTTTSSQVNFRDSAFVITPDTIQIAGRDQSTTVWLYTRVGGGCLVDTSYTGAKNLDAWLTLDASHPAGATVPTIGALTLPTAAPASNPASNNLALTFTNGTASFNLSTTDVGKYVLNLRDDTRLYATAVDLSGASGSITTRPWLHVTVTGNPGASAATGTVFTSAGTNFTATVRGILWQAADDADNNGVVDSGADLTDNSAALRFAWDTSLAAAAPYTPAAGTLGSVTNNLLLQADFASGSASRADVRYSEVGSMTLTATASSYLNSAGVSATGNVSPVGRFTPAYFDVTRIHGCTGGATFTYSGQTFTVTATARAANSGATTTNFDGTLGFSKATTISNAGDASNFTNNVLAAANFTIGAQTKTDVTYTFPAKETTPATLNLRAIDTDSVSSAGHTEEAAEIRSGRVHIYNAYGSELLDLLMTMRVEYYTAADGWVKNTSDTCSSAGLSAFANYQGNLISGETCVQDTGNPGISGQGCTVAGPVSEQYRSLPSATDGTYNLYLMAPGAGNEGSVDVSANLGTKTWLRYDWDGNSTEDDPTGKATFGIYKGSPKHIYLRQRYN